MGNQPQRKARRPRHHRYRRRIPIMAYVTVSEHDALLEAATRAELAMGAFMRESALLVALQERLREQDEAS